MDVFIASGESDRFPTVPIPMDAYGDNGVLVSRAGGAKAHDLIEHEIAALPDEAPVAFDFSKVRAMDVPFADESIAKLVGGKRAGYLEDHPLLALKLSPDVRDSLRAALRQRGLSLLSVNDDGVELLGGDEVMARTLDAARKLGEFSVAEIADELDLKVQAANNRLRSLVESGALTRVRVVPERGGREFRYRFPELSFGGRRSPGGSRSTRSRRRAAAGV
jgi:hypothetical protein